MANLKWLGSGVFSFKGKDYGHGTTMPDIPKETLKALKKRNLVGSIVQAEPAVTPKAVELSEEAERLKMSNAELKEQLIPDTPAPQKDAAGPKKEDK